MNPQSIHEYLLKKAGVKDNPKHKPDRDQAGEFCWLQMKDESNNNISNICIDL